MSGLKFNNFGINKLKKINSLGIYHIDNFYTDSFDDIHLMKISKNVFYVKGDKVSRINNNFL